jgi:hypothetical protein
VNSSWDDDSHPSFPTEPPSSPVAGPPPSMRPSQPKSNGRGRTPLLLAVGGLLIVGLVFSSWQWSNASERADRLQRQVDEFEATEEARQAEADRRPDLFRVARAIDVDDNDVDYRGDATSLEVNIEFVYGDALDWFEALLDDLDFPTAVRSRIGQTRALDGTQEAATDHVRVTWTYHPDDGLSAVFSVED